MCCFSITGIKTSMPQNDLVILHFNDVYNLEPQKEEPVGGAARFVSCVKSYQSLNPLVLFSGDVLNPSLCKHVKVQGKWYIKGKASEFLGLKKKKLYLNCNDVVMYVDICICT